MRRINSLVKRDLRRELYHRALGLCEYCGKKAPLGGGGGTVDHYLPQALGGTNRRDNLRWACYSCNQLKGCMAPEKWEKVKPPFSKSLTSASRHETRIALLSRLAQRQPKTSES